MKKAKPKRTIYYLDKHGDIVNYYASHNIDEIKEMSSLLTVIHFLKVKYVIIKAELIDNYTIHCTINK